MNKREESVEREESLPADKELNENAEKPKFKAARAEFGGDGSGPDNDQNQP